MVIAGILVSVVAYLLIETIMEILLGPEVSKGHLKKYIEKFSAYDRKTNKKKKKVPKYKEYHISRKVYIRYSILTAGGIFLFSIVFFRNIGTAFVFSLGGFLYPPVIMKRKLKKRRELLNLQLKDAMQSISNSLKAGSSLQRAIERCLEDMQRMLRTQIEKPIINELEIIVYEIKLGKSLEEALINFRNRIYMEDVDSFVNAAIITKEKGGNLTEVMANVAEAISEKMEIKRKIMTLTAGKRAEAKLLTFMPVALVFVLSITSPTYMKPMYETLLGKIMMIFGTLLLIANYIIGQKVVDIDI